MKFIFIVLVIAAVAWYPWITKEEAMDIVDMKVAEVKRENPNLCAISADRSSIRKVPFGYTEEIYYDCTVTDSTFGVLKSNNLVFVTFYKGLMGMKIRTINEDL